MWKYFANINSNALSNDEISLTVLLYYANILIIGFFATMICIYCLFVLLSFNVGYSSMNSSKYWNTYGWIISVALIDGIAPTIIYGITIIGALLLISLFIVSMNKIEKSLVSMNKIEKSLNGSGNPESKIYHQNYTNLLILFALQLFNLTFLVIINVLYQQSLSNTSYNYSMLMTIQAAMSLFKIFWSVIVIPLFHLLSKRYLSSLIATQHHLVMLITIFIIAPMIATIFINQSCFYFVWNQANPIETSFTTTVSLSFLFMYPITSTLSFTPAYNYSYNCG